MDRRTQIENCLREAFQPESLEVIDESHLHAGHAGAKSGKGHFDVLIVSEKFRDQNQVNRHRLVYQALGELMSTDIHALSIKAFTPDEI
jgi:BolA protein